MPDLPQSFQIEAESAPAREGPQEDLHRVLRRLRQKLPVLHRLRRALQSCPPGRAIQMRRLRENVRHGSILIVAQENARRQLQGARKSQVRPVRQNVRQDDCFAAPRASQPLEAAAHVRDLRESVLQPSLVAVPYEHSHRGQAVLVHRLRQGVRNEVLAGRSQRGAHEDQAVRLRVLR